MPIDEDLRRKLKTIVKRKIGRTARTTGKALKATLTGNTKKLARTVGTKTSGRTIAKNTEQFGDAFFQHPNKLTSKLWFDGMAAKRAHKDLNKKLPSQRESIKDSLSGLINGQPLNFVIDELLQPKYDGSSTQPYLVAETGVKIGKYQVGNADVKMPEMPKIPKSAKERKLGRLGKLVLGKKAKVYTWKPKKGEEEEEEAKAKK
jgi:hypothetical protein